VSETQAGQFPYDAYYFAHDCGRPYQRDEAWLGFFGGIADQIVRQIGPRTVLDAGCAMGFLVESLRDRGVEAYGLDVSEYAIQRVRPDIRRYCWVGSVTDALPQRYDLIVCIEVLEHLAPGEADVAIANLCAHTDDALFSSTPLDYKEATHVNVQPPEHWADLFARHSLYRDVDFDAGFITPWAARFRRSGQPVHRVVRDYERKLWLLRREATELRARVMEMREQSTQVEASKVALEERLAQVEASKVALEERLAQVEASKVALEERLAQVEASKVALEERLQGVLCSRSWRFTRAVRRLVDWVMPPGSVRARIFRLR
jgi:SAM-dependent methyltransferase